MGIDIFDAYQLLCDDGFEWVIADHDSFFGKRETRPRDEEWCGHESCALVASAFSAWLVSDLAMLVKDRTFPIADYLESADRATWEAKWNAAMDDLPDILPYLASAIYAVGRHIDKAMGFAPGRPRKAA